MTSIWRSVDDAIPPRLRVGLIGCGGRGAANASAVAGTSTARPAMMMDVDASLAKSLAGRFGVPWTTSLEELLSNREVDAVLISTPNHLHAAQIMEAARYGKHIMVEKPLATSLDDANSAVDEARKAGVKLSVFLSYRYLPEVVRARALIEAGTLGDLYGVSLMFQHDKGPGYWYGGDSGRASSEWRMRHEMSGGGVLIHSAIHFVDWLRFLPGREVVEVSACAARLENPGDVEDGLVMWLRYDNGALGTVNTASCVRGTESVTECRLWGADGYVSLTPPFQFYSLRVVNGTDPTQWHEFDRLPRVAHSRVYIERFAKRVLAGEEPEITGHAGIAAQAIVEAAYRSARTGRPVEVAAVQRIPPTGVAIAGGST